jgi:rhomboid protease GluP
VRGRSFHEDFPITAFLLLFNFAFFALEMIEHRRLDQDGELPRFEFRLGNIHAGATKNLGSLDAVSVRQGEYWRLISAAFLHGGYVHLLFNAWVLWDLGRIAEPLLSSWKFLVVYVVSLLGGSLGSLAWQIERGFGSSVGASGALCGLIGLLLVYSIRQRQHEMRDSLVRWIAQIVILSLLASGGGAGIDHAGHLGGFIAGGLLGFTVKNYLASREAARWRYPGFAAFGVLLLCLGTAIWHYFDSR